MADSPVKRRKLEGQGNSYNLSRPIITDPRFSNIQSDPRYRLPSKNHTQVKLDKRFSRILKDDDFARKARVDRYGRPLETNSERKRLERRYEFEEDDEAEKGDAIDDAELESEVQRLERAYDPLRHEAQPGSSSSGDSSSDEEEEQTADLDESGTLVHLEKDVPMGEVSSRIAIVNLDWDNIRADDLIAVFSSFLPPSGQLLKVSIYPSEFGRERMDREEMEGPPKEIFAPSNVDMDENGTDESSTDDEHIIRETLLNVDQGDEFDSAKLRKYQLERLRYFYAVLTFSSPPVAKAVYDAVDGTEYLSTANFFDLRFVPDETDFTSDTPREECDKIPDGYKPTEFVTDALQHSTVKLTWDAEDSTRKEAQARAFRGGRKEIDENDLKAYLGSDISDEDGVNTKGSLSGRPEPSESKKQEERQKMRALLGLSAEPVRSSKKDGRYVGDLQITFSSGFSGTTGLNTSVFENEPEIEETTVEKYVRKERERKHKRKEKSKPASEGIVLASPEEAAGDATAENPAEEVSDLGFDDPFFAAPENDKVSASRKRKEERLKKKAAREAEEAGNAMKRAELELLMVDDKDAEVRHFDMNEIAKAEKRGKKKGKRDKKGKDSGEQPRDEFHMNTKDPRFARLYESHEFSIDPNNPRFKGTAGMRALLDEGRKRRSHQNPVVEAASKAKQGRPRKSALGLSEGDDDVRELWRK